MLMLMLELTLGTEQQSTLPHSLAPSRLRFAWTMAAALFLSGDAQSTHIGNKMRENGLSPAPVLSAIPEHTNLLGLPFRIGENGPEACLCIENQYLVLTFCGEKYIVQKICTAEGISLDLTPMCVTSCSTIASLHADGDGITGRISLPFVQAMEHRMESEVMLQLGEQLQNEKVAFDAGKCICLEWKNAQGKVLGSATLKPSPRATSLASR